VGRTGSDADALNSIFRAGDSAEGRDFAARDADVVFSARGEDFDDALAFAEGVRVRLTAAGRPEGDLRILPGTEIVIGPPRRGRRRRSAGSVANSSPPPRRWVSPGS
jgi:alkanesulfonate monooxygenase SsuD/methylene tetrahydromethanopterin reductase-like flavin-dependent oxidoreductase (luciferase family)